MKDYEPRPDFVSRVMTEVRAVDSPRDGRLETFLSRSPFRYALPAGGVLLAVMNIMRMVFAYLSPALCN